jgi:hypothetical protein
MTDKQKQTAGFVTGALVAVGIAGGAWYAMRATALTAAPATAAVAPAPQQAEVLFVSGTIEGDVKTPVTIFVMARDGNVKGHPFLAKRIDAQSFPVQFALTSHDLMAGGEPPAQLQLEARVDRDGDVVTKEKDAPKVVLGGVAVGSTDVVLKLQ